MNMDMGEMYKGIYREERKKRDEDRMRRWKETNVRYCADDDFPSFVKERLMKRRPGTAFDLMLFGLLLEINKRWKKQIKWCQIGGKTYINEDGIYKLIDFIKMHEYMPPWECDKWYDEMVEFFASMRENV